jgi:hypothetical protein
MDPGNRWWRVQPCCSIKTNREDRQVSRIVVLTIAALGFTASIGLAPTDAHAYTVKGNVDCPDVIKEDADESFLLANQFWLLGYVTARSYNDDEQVGSGVDDDVIYGMVLAYCRKNSSSDMDDAAIRVYEILSNLQPDSAACTNYQTSGATAEIIGIQGRMRPKIPIAAQTSTTARKTARVPRRGLERS